MKKIIFLLSMVAISILGQAQQAYQGYLAALDTLTNADSHRDTIKVSGAKSNVSFQVRILKISGTVAGSVKVYGSVDGVYYATAAVDSVTLTDASNVYQFKYNYNPFSHWIVVAATTGTSSASTRAAMMWRKE